MLNHVPTTDRTGAGKNKSYFLNCSYFSLTILNAVSRTYKEFICFCLPCSVDNVSSTVFAWGSNSSHQLAECGSEKILLPKKVDSFSNAQLVCIDFAYHLIDLFNCGVLMIIA